MLGHSHEPRHRALNRTTSKQLQNYMNSGAAGRFENLIWCVEIVDGVGQVAAWHRPGGPRSNTAPERHTYTPDVFQNAGWLVPSRAAVPLPVVGSTAGNWLMPVLHAALSAA